MARQPKTEFLEIVALCRFDTFQPEPHWVMYREVRDLSGELMFGDDRGTNRMIKIELVETVEDLEKVERNLQGLER